MRSKLTILLFFIAYTLSAASFDSIIESAESMSIDEENASISYESSLIAASLIDLDDKFGYSISMRAEPIDSEKGFSVSELGASVIFPDGDTEINASIPFSIGYGSREHNVSPSLSFSHTFDWTHDDKYLSSLEAEYARFSAFQTYDDEIRLFRKSIVSLLSSMLENERTRLEAENELNKLRKDFSDSLALRVITEDSVLYRERELLIERTAGQFEAAEDERAYLEALFTAYTGLAWDGVDDIPEPVFPSLDGESMALRDAYYRMEIADEEYLVGKSRIEPFSLTIGGNVSSSVSVIDDSVFRRADDYISASALLSLDTKEWSFDITGGGSWDERFSFTPELSIGVSWNRDTASDEDKAEVQRLLNAALTASNDYRKAFIDDYDEKTTLVASILSWRRSYDEAIAEHEYYEKMLGYQRELFSRGLGTEESLEDAALDEKLASLDIDILLLSGLSLMLDAEGYAL